MENIIWKGPKDLNFFVVEDKSKGIAEVQVANVCLGMERFDWNIANFTGSGFVKIALNIKLSMNSRSKTWALENIEIEDLKFDFFLGNQNFFLSNISVILNAVSQLFKAYLSKTLLHLALSIKNFTAPCSEIP
jgi:hypothetical protein